MRRWRRVPIMAGRPQVGAGEQQLAGLNELARSERRDEADRARAIPPSLEGWTSKAIGSAFGVTADSVRHRRQWYARRAAGSRRCGRRLCPAPPASAACRRWRLIAAAILSEPAENRTNRTIPRLRAEIARRGGPPISKSRLSILLREKGLPLAAALPPPDGPPGWRGGRACRAAAHPTPGPGGGRRRPHAAVR
jgi:hypothetical protein